MEFSKNCIFLYFYFNNGIAIAVNYFTVNLLSSEWEFDQGNLFGIYINTYYCQFTLAHRSLRDTLLKPVLRRRFYKWSHFQLGKTK